VEGVEVTRLRRTAGGVFELVTTAGLTTADQVVVATGPYHVRPCRGSPSGCPRPGSGALLAVPQPGAAAEGAVLVVGTGQSGCQIAEDLHLAGRRCTSRSARAPRAARRYRGRDTLAWLDEMGHYDRASTSSPTPTRCGCAPTTT
jgi:putative flavoprotein involved in K+ transport